MPYTAPVIGSSDWGTTLNDALADINAVAEDALTGDGATLGTEQDTASLTYTDLTTAGPSISITLNEPRSVIVLIKSQMIQTTTQDDVFMSFEASGATVLAASDSRAVRHNGTGSPEAYAAFAVVQCAAGTTTLTAKYRVEGGVGRFTHREIGVT